MRTSSSLPFSIAVLTAVFSLLFLAAPVAAPCQTGGDPDPAGALAALRLLAGDPAPPPPTVRDIDGDGAIGLAEAIASLAGPPPDRRVASVRIAPATVLLTTAGQQRQLTARAYNAAGEELPGIAFTWSSSRPGAVAVDSAGVITGGAATGSALVTVRAQDVSSPPALALAATPVAGAVLVDDSRVVGVPEPVDPDARFGVGWQYRVRLLGFPLPQPGDILLATGEAQVAGRVAAVTATTDGALVTLELLAAEDMFADLVINEVIDLSRVRPELPAALAPGYDMTGDGSGAYLLQPRPAGRRPQAAVGTRALGPFECSAQTSGPFPFALTGGATGLSVTPALSFALDYDRAHGGLQKLAVAGKVRAEFTVADVLALGFSGKVTCEGEILQIPLPLGGPASLLFGGFVPVGAGFELGGDLNLAQLGFEIKATGEADFEAGVACPNGQNCAALTRLDTRGSLDAGWITPDPSNLTSQLQLKPGLAGYGFAELAIGPRFWRRAQLGFVRAKAGLAQEADLKLVEAQLADDAYKSGYGLAFASSVGTAPDLNDLCQFLRISLAPVELKFTAPISSSPALAAATADVAGFAAGDPVEFRVGLDPASLTYLTVYNIREVRIYRKKVDLFGEVEAILVASETALQGQKDFTLPWTADFDGTVAGNFFAFVVTRFLRFPYFENLELGEVTMPGFLRLRLAADPSPPLPGLPAYFGFASARDGIYSQGQPAQITLNEIHFLPAGGLIPFTYAPDGCTIVGGGMTLGGAGSSHTLSTNATAADASSSCTAVVLGAQDGNTLKIIYDLTAANGNNLADRAYAALRWSSFSSRSLVIVEIDNQTARNRDLTLRWEQQVSAPVGATFSYTVGAPCAATLQTGILAPEPPPAHGTTFSVEPGISYLSLTGAINLDADGPGSSMNAKGFVEVSLR